MHIVDKLTKKFYHQLDLMSKDTSSTSTCAVQADTDATEKCHNKRIALDAIMPGRDGKDGHDSAVNATAGNATSARPEQYELEQRPMPPEDPGSDTDSGPQRSKFRVFAIMVALSVSVL